jgi:anti-anti-sigma factor
MCFKPSFNEGHLICTFTGKLNANCISKIEDEVFRNTERADIVVFDLSKVDYISSQFLRMCLIVAKDKKMNNFSIINVGKEASKVFKISGLYELLKINKKRYQK